MPTSAPKKMLKSLSKTRGMILDTVKLNPHNPQPTITMNDLPGYALLSPDPRDENSEHDELEKAQIAREYHEWLTASKSSRYFLSPMRTLFEPTFKRSVWLAVRELKGAA